MIKRIELGRASEVTKQTAFVSTQLDGSKAQDVCVANRYRKLGNVGGTPDSTCYNIN